MLPVLSVSGRSGHSALPHLPLASVDLPHLLDDGSLLNIFSLYCPVHLGKDKGDIFLIFRPLPLTVVRAYDMPFADMRAHSSPHIIDYLGKDVPDYFLFVLKMKEE